GLRKKILREVALEMGLPRRVAYREKKACQYGSNSQRMIERIAKRRDMRLGEFARNIYEKVFKKPAP
ncbi:asparagine synthase, partial [Thermococci archaeon]